MKGNVQIEEGFGDAALAAAFRDDGDIPPASADFAKRCLAAAVPARRGLWHDFKLAASVAFVASFTTWALTTSYTARPAAGESVLAAVAEDVSLVGVENANVVKTVASATSNESVVNSNPSATVLWRTLNAGQSQMAWEWPDDARSAKLTITGCGKTTERVYRVDDAFPVWNPPVPESFDEDDVYTAKLVFYRGENATGDEVSSLVADGIGFVRGISASKSRMVSGVEAGMRVARR